MACAAARGAWRRLRLRALVVQCALCSQITGMNVMPADFGAPEEYDDYGDMVSGMMPNKQGDMAGMIDHNAGVGARMVFSES